MWVLLKDYAAAEGVTGQAIRDRVKSGKLRSKLYGKKTLVEVPDDYEKLQGKNIEVSDTERRNKALEKRWDTESALKEAKVRNIEADILIKRQRVVEYRERLRVEYCEGVLECFAEGFADLKSWLVDMRLGKEQIQAFKATYGKCLKKFEKLLSKYLKQKDKEEEQEAMVDSSSQK